MKNRLSLTLILLIGFALRLYRLGVQSLWYDETVSAILARKSIPDLIAHTARDIHPPGYYLLLQGWTQLIGETEFALALFSMVFGVLLIAAVYMLGRWMFSARVGLWAASLVALSPYNLWYSQEVRMYTLAAFLGVMAVYFVLRGVQGNKVGSMLQVLPPPQPSPLKGEGVAPLSLKGRGAGGAGGFLAYALTAALGLYVLYYFAFLLIPLNLFLIGYIWRFRFYWRPWLLANIAIILLYLPWLPTAWRQATNPPVPAWRGDIPLTTILTEGWTALSFGESVQPTQIWLLLVLIIGLFCLGLMATKATIWRILLPTLVFGPIAIIYIAPIIGLTDGPLYHVRYVFTYSPFFYIVIGLALAWIWRKQRVAATLIALVLIGGAGLSIWQLHTDSRYASDDLRGAVAFIEEKWRPGDAILINAGYAYTAFQYYAADPVAQYARLADFDPQTADPTYWHPAIYETGIVDGPSSLGWGDPASDFYAMPSRETTAVLEAISQTFPRIWLLRIYDTVSDPDAIIRGWLTNNMRLVEDQVFTGAANMRVQGYMSRHQPAPPNVMNLMLEDQFALHGFTPPASSYHPGDQIHTALWLEAVEPSESPYALSLKLWDNDGNVIAQTEPDEWPVGSHFYTTDWQPGDVIRYPMRLKLPATTPTGQFWLNAILYDSQSGELLEIQQTGENAILLGAVEILSSAE